jgi:tripartite-type tricarboxylate transporter receptor subunit TctC
MTQSVFEPTAITHIPYPISNQEEEMRTGEKRFWKVCLLTSAFCLSAAATAQQYPDRPIRLLVGVAPGGGTDFVSRLIGQKLTEKWGQPVVTDNRTGATGLIAFGTAASAAPDGHTALVFNIGHLMSASLARNPGFDTVRDFAPVTLIATGTLMLAVHSSVPASNVKEFVSYARANAGKLNYASGGNAGVQHLATELLKREAKIELTHVPFKGGGPGTVALVAGEVQAFITNVLSLHPHIKAGRIRGLAVASPRRNAIAPDVPTFAEAGYPTVDVNLWQGMLVPARTPAAVVEKLSAAIAEAVRSPDSTAKLATQGAEPAGTTPKEFAAFLKNERTRWLKLAKEARITIE